MADRRIVILTDGRTNPVNAKTAACVVRYKPEEVVALLDPTQAGRTAGELLGVGGSLPIVATLAEAPNANTLLIGIAPSGGKLPPAWRKVLLEAIDRGMNLVSGLHDFLSNDPEISAAAAKKGVEIHDVRKNNERDVSNRLNLREDCLRIHTVGQDCSVGRRSRASATSRWPWGPTAVVIEFARPLPEMIDGAPKRPPGARSETLTWRRLPLARETHATRPVPSEASAMLGRNATSSVWIVRAAPRLGPSADPKATATRARLVADPGVKTSAPTERCA